jgi:4-hydroxybenzoate polyprenyltransferase
MGIALARTGEAFTQTDFVYAFLFMIGAVAMRGAGCTYNDILDRDIDAKVERTRLRPLPSGAVSSKAALAWLFAQCIVGLAVLITLPRLAQYVALASLPLVALYPLMKRITWWPQAWLGIVFNWGALVAGATITHPNMIRYEDLALYAGCFFWTVAYDTIYALQDREDDALVGVKSTARLFGKYWRFITNLLYAVALFGWVSAVVLSGANWPSYLALAAIWLFLIRPMMRQIDDAKSESALTAFKMNAWIGAGVAIAFALEPLAQTLRPYLGG